MLIKSNPEECNLVYNSLSLSCIRHVVKAANVVKSGLHRSLLPLLTANVMV